MPTNPAMAIILAAGKGTRLKSTVPKPLHEVAGKPLLQFSLDLCHQANLEPTILIYDPKFPEVMRSAGTKAKAVSQPEHHYGTGHAVQAALLAQPQHRATTVVLYADTPLLRPDTVTSLITLRAKSGAAVVVLSAEVENPNGYGRIMRDESSGKITAIIESHMASKEERQICEINTGIMVFESDWLRQNITRISPDPQKGELLLTDTVKLALAQGKDVECLQLSASSEGIGCDRQQDLEKAERLLRNKKVDELMANGVSIEDPDRTYIDVGVAIGSDTRILAGCHILGKTMIGANCRIGPNAQITDSKISDGCTVKHASVLTSIEMADGSRVGPFAHLREGTILDRGVDIGTSSEIKNSKIGTGTVMKHFGFIGDADVGENVNIGAGVITCNYDGTTKHRTTIGNDSFIGSGSMLVAPLAIGDNVYVGAGSVVTRNVADSNIVYGVPARSRATANKDT